MIRTINLLTVLTVLATSQLSLADPEIVEEDVTIRFPQKATAEEIYSMLAKKARRACDSRAIYAHTNLSGEAQCRKQFIHEAVLTIDRPALTALHRERTGTETLVLAVSESEQPRSK